MGKQGTLQKRPPRTSSGYDLDHTLSIIEVPLVLVCAVPEELSPLANYIRNRVMFIRPCSARLWRYARTGSLMHAQATGLPHNSHQAISIQVLIDVITVNNTGGPAHYIHQTCLVFSFLSIAGRSVRQCAHSITRTAFPRCHSVRCPLGALAAAYRG
jgi:hypothetical protein